MTLNRRVRGVSSVVIDTPSGVAAPVSHLAGLGHRRIACLGGPDGSWLDPRRLRGLQEAVPECEVVALGAYPPEFEAGVHTVDAVLDTDCTASSRTAAPRSSACCTGSPCSAGPPRAM
ncbi:type 1 periplasmic-binding domain-containing protein [Streptomyces luteolus]|uniref:Substrate-binding domain-containing protein n=1 Tax=Streptomyces luteolus TaxID=3043615 RepID=A0ABT6SQA0_9ACTN|nr:substrate-binding domain-containing protein [Streptomyces sp. B-S-A12]MDI3417786.1 substrate-binding domain-containing protein [Streptomyces sp. B-S-A12]